jgi:hypothetical protein
MATFSRTARRGEGTPGLPPDHEEILDARDGFTLGHRPSVAALQARRLPERT